MTQDLVLSNMFETAFLEVVGLEGGFVDHPLDRGGPTKWGISKKAFPDLDIANLSVDDARLIYHKHYWIPLRLDELQHLAIASEIFDTAVNAGLRIATRVCQQAVSFLGTRGVSIDGIMGTLTISALNIWIKKDIVALHKCLNGWQFIHFVNIINSNPDQIIFARGWMRRIQFYKEGVKV